MIVAVLLSLLFSYFVIKVIMYLFAEISSKFDNKTDLAIEMFNSKKYSKSLNIFRSISKTHNLTMTNYFTYIGLCHQHLNNKSEAIENFEYAIDSDRYNIDAKLLKVDLEYINNKRQYSKELIEILRDHPNDNKVLIRQARLYSDMKEFLLAEGCLKTILESDRRHYTAQDMLFNLYLKQDDYEKATELSQIAVIKDSPNRLRFQMKLNKLKKV